ncbi:serine hydrolase [Chryseobacterium caseinilyticum]|uniref:Serine hydrolase n=1 Tax=Chryseobacterium caseinilyticum TaxID=2771428 RepID=A0ABR8ZBG0_9FLAO|nr:serine hydrolase [Chryseobacterium caseinilyticum]MBD8082572.1 serine hydrolase [Chryseobacterium caseinilyticum]
MKKLFFLLVLIFSSNILFAQTDHHSTAIKNFQTQYNSGKYELVFNSFSPEMQKALPLESTKQFLEGLRSQAGQITSTKLSTKEGTTAIYNTNFERATLEIHLSLDAGNKVSGLLIQPVTEKQSAMKSEVNNALNTYPKEISDLIFSKTKDFPDNTQVSIAVIKDGKTNYYGILKSDKTVKTSENQNKVFEIGSLTKVFTSTVLASLVTDRKVKLTDEINRFYPFPFKNNVKITFETLANHTSGLQRLPENINLSDISNPYKNYGSEQLYDYLKNGLNLKNNSEKKYDYSNLGAGLLGHTLAVSQKTGFTELLQKRIFDRFKMNNSFTSSKDLGSKLVKGLNADGQEVSNWDFDVLFGGGGILSTTEDLSKFATAQFDLKNTDLTLTRTPTFTVSEKMKMGLGWHILKSQNGNDLFWHNGGTAGYSSSMAIDTAGKTAVVILSNVSAFNPKMGSIDQLCFELMKQIGN